jgi:hypothetical protein
MTGTDTGAAFAEDMPSLIRRAVALAETTCDGCTSYHGGWPATRLARATGGVDADRTVLMPIFNEIGRAQPGGDWLIAGAADSGGLALIAASLGAYTRIFRFTVVDLCPTPLLLCAEYAARHGLQLETARADLLDFVPERKQHLIFAASVLRHLPPHQRADAVARFHDWLAPGGTLVNVTSVDAEPVPDPAAADASVARLLDACRAVGIADAATLVRLEEWRRQRFASWGSKPHSIPEAGKLERLCAAAGFAGIRRLEAVSARSHRRPHEIVLAVKAG